ncbi:YbaK/EbsC family protein [Breoghania sp.]|uniref:YbaK/EbsC family protein n=1 Tax=Breoghania sp. TaxID=2065378 RepID=UPI002635AFC7|nr:YbaK/EbsC family protein [Breoghania sp.]MDJ0931595.1 YbaK/EbsC family protein [Breoghania sp.]
MTALPPSAEIVQNAAETAGLTIRIVEVPGTARTAQDAAESVNSTVGQIVKSLVFRGRDSQKPYLLLVSGDNRVNEKAISVKPWNARTQLICARDHRLRHRRHPSPWPRAAAVDLHG